ncbi:MAG: glycerophosphodiester phosphodiesterase [Candidatus Xenobiia bacterium LiM19]
MKKTLIVIAILLIGTALTSICTAREEAGRKVYAHRGASGYLPEHTLPAYALAHGLGADYIEPDLVLTKDGVFICVHDIYLEDTTNVEEVFPKRARKDGHWYAIDFTLPEIKSLSVHERSEDGKSPVFKNRFPLGKSRFEIATFKEMIELVQGLNRSRGRNTGIIPELKQPSFHAREGQPVEKKFLETVKQYGYDSAGSLIIVQCFEAATLRNLKALGCNLQMMQLVEEPGEDRVSYSEELNDTALREIAAYAAILSPNKIRIEKNPSLVKAAHKAGLKVCPYTFRADAVPDKYSSLEEELCTFYVIYGVDGLFTDFPDRAVRLLDTLKLR